MTETYTLVGDDPSWIIAFFPVPAILASLWVRRKTKLPLPSPWKSLVLAGYFLVLAWVGLPTEWIIGIACISAAGYFCLAPEMKKLKVRARVGFAIYFVAIGFVFIFMMQFLMAEKITLRDSDFSFTRRGTTLTLPRNDLRVNAMATIKPWFSIRAWRSWTSYHGRDVGPHIIGSMIYWGPNGLIHGDDVALHFAKWAGVTPTQTEIHGSTYITTPMSIK